MRNFVTIRIKLLILLGVFAFLKTYTQVPIYTIDQAFGTHEYFKSASSVSDFHFLPDGRILVGGGFDNSYAKGLGMIYSNGQLDESWVGEYEYYNVLEIIAQEDGYVWPTIYNIIKALNNGVPWYVEYNESWGAYFEGGTFNPYTVERVWDIYQMENGDLLLGGAIANDTLLPNELRGLSRIHADGSHDPTFPVLNITPNFGNGAVHRIFHAPDGYWYISGGFTAINGHETNRVAKLTPNFDVDTTFVSPLIHDGFVAFSANIIYVDSLSRVWVSGYQMHLQDNPEDTIQLIRLLPNGEIDDDFLPRKLENTYPDFWSDGPTIVSGVQELINESQKYIVYGRFNYFNDTLQPCITVVDDDGIIQHNYFQDTGASINIYSDDENPKMPQIKVVKQQPDGSVFIGGAFSQFMGEERYSVVKLKPDSTNAISAPPEKVAFNIFPNPTSDKLNITLLEGIAGSGSIYNTLGKQVLVFPLSSSHTQVDIQKLEAGIYFIKIELENGQVAVQKFVKSR